MRLALKAELRMRSLPALVQSEGSKPDRTAPASAPAGPTLCSGPIRSSFLYNVTQSEAEGGVPAGRGLSVALLPAPVWVVLLRYLLLGRVGRRSREGSSLDRRSLCCMRVESCGQEARRGAGGVGGRSACAQGLCGPRHLDASSASVSSKGR